MVDIATLRKGNLLESEVGIVRVESIIAERSRVYCHALDEDYMADYSVVDLKAIPLTVELLNKLGLGSKDKSYGDFKNVTSRIIISVNYDNNGNQFDNNVIINDLHILQNIYFYSYGKEINYNYKIIFN